MNIPDCSRGKDLEATGKDHHQKPNGREREPLWVLPNALLRPQADIHDMGIVSRDFHTLPFAPLNCVDSCLLPVTII